MLKFEDRILLNLPARLPQHFTRLKVKYSDLLVEMLNGFVTAFPSNNVNKVRRIINGAFNEIKVRSLLKEACSLPEFERVLSEIVLKKATELDCQKLQALFYEELTLKRIYKQTICDSYGTLITKIIMPQLNMLVNKPYAAYIIINKALEFAEDSSNWKSKKEFNDIVLIEVLDISYRMGYDFTVLDLFP
jgi:hypothetical protein